MGWDGTAAHSPAAGNCQLNLHPDVIKTDETKGWKGVTQCASGLSYTGCAACTNVLLVFALFLLPMGRLERYWSECNSERDVEMGGKMWEEKEF